MENTSAQEKKGQPAGSQGKFLEGVVVKSAMKDTATVEVYSFVMHPKYKKFMKKSQKFLVHDPGNTTEVGQKVVIRETRPISKLKHFVIVNPDASVGTPTSRRG